MGALQQGLPWEVGVKITPLPEPKKPAYLQALLLVGVGVGVVGVVVAEQQEARLPAGDPNTNPNLLTLS